jgi:antitoxin MazE
MWLTNWVNSLVVAGRRAVEINRRRTVEKAIKRIRRLRRPLPSGFKFNRLDANQR